MPTLQIALAVALTIVVCAIVAWFFSRYERTRRALETTKVVPVRDVRAGEVVRVRGTLVLGASSLEAPFSRRRCAHYDALLEDRADDNWRNPWSPLAHETCSTSFFLEDATGRIEIDTTLFEGIVVRDHHKSQGEVDLDKARAFLTRHGQPTEIAAGRVLRYREGVLEAGEIVTVVGRACEADRGGEKRMVLGDGTLRVRASDEPEIVG